MVCRRRSPKNTERLFRQHVAPVRQSQMELYTNGVIPSGESLKKWFSL